MDKVFILTWDTTFTSREIVGVFTDREQAEKLIVTRALAGHSLSNVSLSEFVVQGSTTFDLRDPRGYPDVISALLESKKILAIKALRTHVSGMGLKEAKDAVEAVDLLNLSVEVREAALALSRPAEPVRYQHAHYFNEYDVLVDGDHDKWVHIGDGKFVAELSGGLLPFKDDAPTPLSESQVEDRYGISDRYDY